MGDDALSRNHAVLLMASAVSTLSALVLFVFVWELSAGFLVLFLLASMIVDLVILLRLETRAR